MAQSGYRAASSSSKDPATDARREAASGDWDSGKESRWKQDWKQPTCQDEDWKHDSKDASRQEWSEAAWKERGWTDWWSTSTKPEAKESDTSGGRAQWYNEPSPEPAPWAQTQQPPARDAEAPFLPTPAPRYQCPPLL